MAGGEWVVVGRVIGGHGVRGEVKVLPETDFPERLAELREVTLLLRNGELREVTIVDGRPHVGKGTMLLTLEGCRTRSEAEGLAGAQLVVRPGQSPPLPEGEYYEWEIVGLRAVTTDGRDLGVVREVMRTGANDVYVTDRCLLPAIGDVVKEIDIEAGKLVVELLPGLLD